MIIDIIYIVALVFISIYAINKITNVVASFKYKYKDVIPMFDYFLSLAYDSIYESDLIVYMSEGDKNIPVKERETIERNFVKQCFLYMGKKNAEIFIKFYGSEETIIVNMIRYLRRKINEDGLSKMIQQEKINT